MIKVDSKKISFASDLKFIDLFAGIGGFRLALNSFGSKCVYTSEWDKYAKEVYKANFDETPDGDITKVIESDIPSHDIICAGFPCQAFSISGKQRGFNDTRGTLFFDIMRIAKFHRPKIIFLENVKNFERHDDGNTMRVVKKTLNDLGYDIFYKVLSSSSFGVPQTRKRIFIVGFNTQEFSGKLNFKFPIPFGNNLCIKDIIEDDKFTSEYVIERNDYIIRENKDLKNNLLFDNQITNSIRIGEINKGGQGDRIYSEFGAGITLSAYGGGLGAKTGLYYINDKVRKLTPRECARLQGFPESFKIHQNKNQAYKQFGNSVTVDLIQLIYFEILKVIKNQDISKNILNYEKENL